MTKLESSANKETAGGSSPATATAEKPSLDDKMQNVLSLIMSRTHGQATDDAVEKAVSSLLPSSCTTSKRPATTKAPPWKKAKEPVIVMDTDNYDDLEEPPPVATRSGKKQKVAAPENAKQSAPEAVWKGRKATVESMREQVADEVEDPLDGIPLGKAGSRMLVTFGDGRDPKPEAVSAALMGARRCLQMAIKDARALRREAKAEYLRARATVKQGKSILRGNEKHMVGGTKEAVDPQMLYRAMAGYDRLSYEPKCGFDFQQLQQLFPEEMNAYERWTQMHKAYESSKKSDDVQHSAEAQDEVNDQNGSEVKSDVSTSEGGALADGHLKERLAQFDARTEQMKDDWYIKFAEVRQGSFLPRATGRRNAQTKQWEESRKRTRKRGRTPVSWGSLSAQSVQFLHWVGFDHRSALPPPSEETTQALAFLGYDFMGRIIEKAIFLRSLAKHEDSKRGGVGGDDFLLELQEGEQLEAHDIERSLNDSTIRPVPLYSSTDSSMSSEKVATQLYFGPGFEHRLEMEMNELVAGKDKKNHLSDEERRIRRQEDELFERLKSPPVVDGHRSIMEEATRSANMEETGDDELEEVED